MISLKFRSPDRILPPWLAPAALAATLLVAACAPAPTRPTQAGDAARQAAAEAALGRNWEFHGKVALSQGREGGTLNLRWRQQGEDFRIDLSAPITRQGWRLTSEAGRFRLEGLEGGAREGEDAEALLLEATGWRIPVSAMSHWVRGARGGDADADFTADPEGRIATLRQDGWDIEYREWFAATPPLPRKVFARKAEASVRLAIEAWDSP
jgi:outer membrane lipoprotein LolB